MILKIESIFGVSSKAANSFRDFRNYDVDLQQAVYKTLLAKGKKECNAQLSVIKNQLSKIDEELKEFENGV